MFSRSVYQIGAAVAKTNKKEKTVVPTKSNKTNDIKFIRCVIREAYGRVVVEASTKDYFPTDEREGFTTFNSGLGEGGEDYDLSDRYPLKDVSAKEWREELVNVPVAELDLYLHSCGRPDGYGGYHEGEMLTNVQVRWESGALVQVRDGREILWTRPVITAKGVQA